MKKYLYIALAAAALTSCSSDEAIEMVEKRAIGFDNVFVNNATRATDLNKDNITEFGVYASVSANNTQGMILSKEKRRSDTTILSIGLPVHNMTSQLSLLIKLVQMQHGHILLLTQRMVQSNSIMRLRKLIKIFCLHTYSQKRQLMLSPHNQTL